MEQAKHDGKIVTAIDVLNQNGLMIHSKRTEFKLISANKELLCLVCDEPLVFNAGVKKKPYFSHWKGTYDSDKHTPIIESFEHKDGKHVLYKYLKHNNMKDIVFDKKLNINRWANLYIEDENNPLIIEYIVNAGEYSSWIKKCKDYKLADLDALWIIDSISVNDRRRELDGYYDVEYQLGELDSKKRIFILDRENKVLTIEKYMEHYIGDVLSKRELFKSSYNLYDIEFKLEVGFMTDKFDCEYMKAYENFLDNCMGQTCSFINSSNETIKEETTFSSDFILSLFERILKTSIDEKQSIDLYNYIKANGISVLLDSGVSKIEFKKKLWKTQGKYSYTNIRSVLIDIEYLIKW